MKIRNNFLSYVIALHVILTALAYLLLAYNKYFFFGIQLLVIISLFVTYRLYRDFIKPLEILAAGVEAIRDQDFSCTIIKTGNEEPDRLIEVYNRMIERLRLERRIQQEQHYFLERLINAASIGVVILDLDANIYLLNPAAEKILGRNSAEVAGRPLWPLVQGPLACLSDMKTGESRVVHLDGIRIYRCYKSQFQDRGFPRQFILLEELTEEIVEIQKKAYEKVIRAMSHEVNNSVGAINSILHSILDYKGQLKDRDAREYQEIINIAIERNTGLGRFMANYAEVVKIPPPQKRKYDLHDLLRSLQVLMQKECNSRNIDWRSEYCAEAFEIEMDVNQMEQVLINIAKNAVEAIERHGSIIVKTSTSPRILRFIDSGCGLGKDSATQLFTPFYTSKKAGQGIGLTLIREILTNHGFAYDLKANIENKTEFRIIFDQ